MEQNKKKKIMKLSILVVSILVILIGLSYAYTQIVLRGEKSYIIISNNLKVYLDESKTLTDVVEATNVIPVADYKGKQNEGYYFSLVNESNENINYRVYLDLNDDNTMPTYALRYNLVQEENAIDITENLDDSMVGNEFVLHEDRIVANSTHNYTLKVWLGLQAENDAKNKVFSGKIRIGAVQASEYVDASGANYPELTSGMIPVVYNETKNTWEKANLTEPWYDYETQMWANAVTVTESTRDAYMEADAGTAISMDDINTMWVWIPRYEYQYTDLGTSYAGGTAAQPGEIKINFITKGQTEPSDGSTYKIPEGFKFGTENIPGFWMAKFETSTLESCTAGTHSIGTNCDLTTLTPQVKPNVTSWRGARISTYFQVSRLMQSSSNASIYGFDIDGTGTMDIHLLKNSEWGIVAMLSQSKYGKYGNLNYAGVNKEIYQNKSSSYLTGMSNGTPSSSTYASIQVTYDTPDTGYGASTTGTIYGVYDMSGGAFDYVMGNYSNYSGTASYQYNSGFCGTGGPSSDCLEWPNVKYYDLYSSATASSAYKFGDSTYETSAWYKDGAGFVASTYPWLTRGGYCNSDDTADGTSAGIFDSNNGSFGRSLINVGSRLSIKP